MGFFQNPNSPKPTRAGYVKRRINLGQPNVTCFLHGKHGIIWGKYETKYTDVFRVLMKSNLEISGFKLKDIKSKKKSIYLLQFWN